MKRKALFAFALAGSTAFAGSFIPSMSVVVNEKDNAKQIDPAKFGYIGLVYRASYKGVSKMDLKETTTGDKVRIWMNPELENSISFSIGPVVVGEKKFAKDTVAAPAILQQIPPGTYVTSYFYLNGKSSGISLRPDTLKVEAGRILSLDRVVGEVELVPLIQTVKSFRVRTESALSDSAYAAFGSLGISTTNIVHRPVDLAKD